MKGTTNKYWENEEAIITEATGAEVRYYKEAGKIQLYATYEKDGETKIGKGAVWSTEDMGEMDAVKLAFAVMDGLKDSGISNDAFADAYELLKAEMGNVSDDDEEEDAEDTLDDEFEDEIPDYKSMKIGELKQLCFECDIKVPAKATAKAMIALLDAYYADNATDDEEEDDEEETNSVEQFVGKNIIWDGESYKKANRKVGKDYIEWMKDADEWVSYMVEEGEKIAKMPTKTQKQKKAQDKVYGELNAEVKEWVDAWDGYCDVKVVSEITRALVLGKLDYASAMVRFASIIDGLKF